MKWWGYFLCGVLVLAAFPLSMALTGHTQRKGNLGGAVMMAGLAFMTVADPKVAAAIEQIDKRRDLGDTEQDAIGDGDEEAA